MRGVFVQYVITINSHRSDSAHYYFDGRVRSSHLQVPSRMEYMFAFPSRNNSFFVCTCRVSAASQHDMRAHQDLARALRRKYQCKNSIMVAKIVACA